MNLQVPTCSGLNQDFRISPGKKLPFPKAGAKKISSPNNLQKRNTLILTDTPVKKIFENEYKKEWRRKRSNFKIL